MAKCGPCEGAAAQVSAPAMPACIVHREARGPRPHPEASLKRVPEAPLWRTATETGCAHARCR
eukprot:3640349-Alexandrium_andersonii.AAC.1